MTKEEMRLHEAYVRAKIALENHQKRSKTRQMVRGHHDQCATELDPEGFRPCTCGVYGGTNEIKKLDPSDYDL